MKYYIENGVAVGVLNSGREFVFDVEDFDRVSKWNCYSNGEQISINVNGCIYQLARFIVGIKNKVDRKCYFLNGDKTDFRKSNLWYENQYIDCGDYCKVVCRDGREFLIDLEDKDLVSKFVWHVDNGGYVISSRGNNGKAMKLHRLVMNVLDKTMQEVEIDHINQNTLDNRKAMLRKTDRSGNCSNKAKFETNSSGFVGVYQMTGYDKWCAQINVSGKRIYLGSFDDIRSAAEARMNAEKKYGIQNSFNKNCMQIDNQQRSPE